MNQDNDNSNGEATGDRYSSSFTIPSETNKYTGTIVADVGINNLDEISVYLERVGGSPITSNRQTWLVIHGRQEVTSIGHGASTMESLAVAVDAYRSTDQVLLLDWTQGSSDNHFPEFLDGAILDHPCCVLGEASSKRCVHDFGFATFPDRTQLGHVRRVRTCLTISAVREGHCRTRPRIRAPLVIRTKR